MHTEVMNELERNIQMRETEKMRETFRTSKASESGHLLFGYNTHSRKR